MRKIVAQPKDELYALDVRHEDVGDDELRRLRLRDMPLGRGPVLRFGDAVAIGLEMLAQRPANRVVIVDNQNSRHPILGSREPLARL